MAITEKKLRRLQAGQETVKGTQVAATVALIVNDASFDLRPTIYTPKQDIGILADRHPGIEVGRHIAFSIDADASYEQLPYWLAMAVKKVVAAATPAATIVSSSVANPTVITTSAAHGFNTGDVVTIASHTGSTPTINGVRTVTVTGATTFTIPVNVSVGGTGGTATRGSSADKVWPYIPSAVGADDFMTFTLETRHTDGTNSIDRAYTYCMAQKLTLSGGLDNIVKLKIDGFAKDEIASALTAAIAIPTAHTLIPSQLMKLSSDSSFALAGTTPVTGQMYGWTIEIDTGLTPAMYDDGALTMSRHRRNGRMVKLTLNLDQEASSGLGETMRTRLKSRALSYLELKSLGAVLGDSFYMFRLDGAYGVESVSPPSDHEGEDAITVVLSSKYDDTAAQDFKLNLVTAAATLP